MKSNHKQRELLGSIISINDINIELSKNINKIIDILNINIKKYNVLLKAKLDTLYLKNDNKKIKNVERNIDDDLKSKKNMNHIKKSRNLFNKILKDINKYWRNKEECNKHINKILYTLKNISIPDEIMIDNMDIFGVFNKNIKIMIESREKTTHIHTTYIDLLCNSEMILMKKIYTDTCIIRNNAVIIYNVMSEFNNTSNIHMRDMVTTAGNK